MARRDVLSPDPWRRRGFFFRGAFVLRAGRPGLFFRVRTATKVASDVGLAVVIPRLRCRFAPTYPLGQVEFSAHPPIAP
jgi:hypothetical protein